MNSFQKVFVDVNSSSYSKLLFKFMFLHSGPQAHTTTIIYIFILFLKYIIVKILTALYSENCSTCIKN